MTGRASKTPAYLCVTDDKRANNVPTPANTMVTPKAAHPHESCEDCEREVTNSLVVKRYAPL
jgi:hypothetical protein